jgi:hypothetical protein
MKKVSVKYIIPGQDFGKVVERYLIETIADMQTAFDLKKIGVLHKAGIINILAKGDTVVLNENGGYCGMKVTWEKVK